MPRKYCGPTSLGPSACARDHAAADAVRRRFDEVQRAPAAARRRSRADRVGGKYAPRLCSPDRAHRSSAELGGAFTFARALDIGLVPLVHEAADPARTFLHHLPLYVREELQERGSGATLEELGASSRASASRTRARRMENVARVCDVSRKTAERYLGVLEDFLLPRCRSPIGWSPYDARTNPHLRVSSIRSIAGPANSTRIKSP